MNNKESTEFLDGFNNYLRGGNDVLNSLDFLLGSNKRRSKLLNKTKSFLSVGKNLSEVFLKFKIISSFEAKLISIGENTGDLETVLDRVVYLRKEKSKINSKILSSLMYPALVSILGFCLVIFLSVYIFPQISRIFLSMKVELPLITKVLINISGFINSNLFRLFLTLIIVAMIFGTFFAFREGRMFINWLFNRGLLVLPLVRRIYLRYWSSIFLEILSLLIKYGSYDRVENLFRGLLPRVLSLEYFKTLSHFSSGKELTYSLALNKYFPKYLLNQIKVYERTGVLESKLSKISEKERSDLINRLQVLTNLIEPLIILLIGGVVMIIALSVILPIYKMSGSMKI